MEFSNRRLLLVNEDVPITTSIPPLPHIHGTTTTNNNSSSPPESMTSPSSMFRRPLQLPLRPFFTSNLAFAFLILFIALFFIAFIFLYIRQFSDTDSSSSSSSHRRRRFRRHLSHQGVDPTSAKSLPVFSYNGDAKQMDCAICLDEFRVGDSVKMITYCKHVFHPECIDTWLSAHVTCPVCRCTKLADEDGERSTAENGEGVREVGSESQ